MASTHNSNCEATASLPVSQNRLSIVVALLSLSVFINYIDRGNLSIAAPMLKDELHLSGSQLGILLSSFFWTYGIFLVLSGWLVDRLNATWVMAFGFLLWSAATGVTGFLHSFTAMLVARLFLGAGESVAPHRKRVVSSVRSALSGTHDSLQRVSVRFRHDRIARCGKAP